MRSRSTTTGRRRWGGGRPASNSRSTASCAPGDQTQFTTLQSPGSDRLRYYALNVAEPVGSATVTANAGYLRTRIGDISGQAYSGALMLSLPVYRFGQAVVTPTAAIDGINLDNAFVGETFASDHTRAARVSLSYVDATGPDTFSLVGAISRGLDIFGARVASAALSDASFTKLTYVAGVDRSLGPDWAVRVRSQGQWGLSRLPSVEQFALGGESAGRAFDGVTTLGDSGVYGSVELARLFAQQTPGPFLPAEAYGFADAGYARYRARLGYAGIDQSLSSLGLGLRSTIAPHLVFQLEGAHALSQDLPIRQKKDRVSLALRLTL